MIDILLSKINQYFFLVVAQDAHTARPKIGLLVDLD